MHHTTAFLNDFFLRGMHQEHNLLLPNMQLCDSFITFFFDVYMWHIQHMCSLYCSDECNLTLEQ